MKVIMASGNSGKILELEKTLAPLSWTLLPLSNYNPPIIEEVGSTFDENAIICKKTGIHIMPLKRSIDIDDEFEFKLIKKLIKKKGTNNE